MRYLIILTLCAACGKAPNQDAEDAAPVPTRDLELSHGNATVCWHPNGVPTLKIYCWPADGSAAPAVVLTTTAGHEFTTIYMYQSGVCAAGPNKSTVCYGTQDTSAGTWLESVTCAVTSSDSVYCPDEAQAKALTFN